MKKISLSMFLIAVLIAPCAYARSDWGWAQNILNIPHGTELPTGCGEGDGFYDTDATAGQQVYVCNASGSWVLQGDGGGAASISDTAYGGSWNGDTTVAPSKNAVYDKIETLGSASGWTDSGTSVYTTTSTDNVGIGTHTPANLFSVGTASQFQVNSSGAITQLGGVSTSTLSASVWALAATNATLKNASTNAAANTVVQGGSGAGANSLTLKTTSGVGSGDYINLLGGNNGGTEIARFFGSGSVGIGTTLNSAITGLSVMNGNVGIGTWSPASQLDVKGTVRYLTLTDSTGGLSITSTYSYSGGSTSGTLMNLQGNSLTSGVAYSASANGGNFTGDLLRLSYTGNNSGQGANIGIGTLGTGNTLKITQQGSGNIALFEDVASDTTPFIINAGGAVGIGTTTVLDGALQVLGDNVAIGSGTNTNATATGELYVQSDLEVDGTAYFAVAQVTDDAYAAGWDSSTAVPTKNAIYDKIEALGTSSGGWVDNGATMIQSTTADNVGIGTTSPTVKLEVKGTVLATEFQTASSNTPQTQFYPTNAGDTHWIWGMNSNGGGSSDDAIFLAEGTDVTASQRVAVLPGGNMGIGTINPLYKLEVNGTMKATSFTGDGSALTNVGASGWADGGTNVYTTATTDRVGIGTTTPNANGSLEVVKQSSLKPLMISSVPSGGGNLMVVTSDGNVGVGTIQPTVKLQVVGTVNATAFTGDGSALSGIGAGGWTDGGTNVYTTATTDNVGIGTTTPSTTLEIVKQGSQKPFMVSSVATGDGDYLTISSSGNLGIGTTTPGRNLVIHTGDTSVYPSIGLCNSVGECFRAEMNATSDTARASIGSAQNVSLDFNANDVTLLKLEASGNVGIGTVGSGGAIFVSPDGSCSKCGPNNADAWLCASVTCP